MRISDWSSDVCSSDLHYYLALYWAQALAAQDADASLKATFAPLAAALADNEAKIVEELVAVQGKPVDIGGYYRPDPARAGAAMRPSTTLNATLERSEEHTTELQSLMRISYAVF